MTEVKILSNGITVILSPNERAETICVLIGVAIGANHEKENEYGLAHFFEHMCFKGTKTYPTNAQLMTRMEESGLVANAYTDREYTAYHISGRSEKVEDMIAITADIFLNSLFPESELDKEKKVITEEIAMYKDDPVARAFDEVDMALFRDTAAGHHTLGTIESVSSFSRDNFTRFLEKHYVAENTIISISGNFDREKVMQRLESAYKNTPKGERDEQIVISPQPIQKKHQCVVREDLEQAHIIIGGYAPAYTGTNRHTTEVFDVLIGGSMSSRLFFRVREKLGACYMIRTCINLMTHTGGFYIYTGIAGKRTNEVMEAIADECAIIKKIPVNEKELQKAKEFLLGLNAVQEENNNTVATTRMHAYAQAGRVEEKDAYEKNILAVTPEDIQRVANTILDKNKLNVCYIANIAIKESITDNFLDHI